jgi:hypothetical protein
VGKEQTFEVPDTKVILSPANRVHNSPPPWKGDSEWKEGHCISVNTANATPQDSLEPAPQSATAALGAASPEGIRDGSLTDQSPSDYFAGRVAPNQIAEST